MAKTREVITMLTLQKKINAWVRQGLLSEEQAQAIALYESSRAATWIFSSLLILGVLVVSLGFIALVVAHWNNISDFLKLAGDFLILVVSGVYLHKTYHAQKWIQFESMLLFFLIFFLASMGLVYQVYHITHPFYEALLLGSVITLPLAFLGRILVVPFTWVMGFLIGLCWAFPDNMSFASVLRIPLFCGVITLIGARFLGEIGLVRAFRCWTFVSGFICVVGVQLSRGELYLSKLVYDVIGYGMAVLLAYLLCRSDKHSPFQKSLLLSMLVLFLIVCYLYSGGITFSLAYSVLAMAIVFLFALLMASLKQRRLFQIALAFLWLQFFMLYVEYLGTLFMTGIGLIFSGVLLLGAVILWKKHHHQLENWAEGLSKWKK